MSPINPRARHNVLGVVAFSLFAALFTRLWYLQVLTTDEYAVAARNNRLRVVIQEAPRGRILDRNGMPLVENRRTIQVTIDYQDFIDLDEPVQAEVLRRLARELTTDEMARYRGERQSDDAGPIPDEPSDEVEGDDETTEPGTSAPGGEAGSGSPSTDPEGDEPEAGQSDDEPDPRTRPPAGVATGADNPDGQGGDGLQAPDAVTVEILRERLEDKRFSKFKPVPVASGVSEQLELYIIEHDDLFPTVAVERVAVRDYRYGALLAHVLGYVGPVTQAELDEFQSEEKPYENDDQIGKSGIERELERHLRGTPGQVVYEVDARNRPVRELRDRRQAPKSGNDVYLTIDINLQFMVEKGLAAEIERRRAVRSDGCPETTYCDPPGGAAAAVNPQTGEVLAMASYPTYDPNLFVGGISQRDYDAISLESRVDQHHNPLINRAISGQYLPGSTFKLFSAYAGLATNQITPDEVYNDTGVYNFSANCNNKNCRKSNAGGTDYGAVTLPRALTVSSDTYFYRLGDLSWRRRAAIGEEALQDKMRLFGLGRESGIALPFEEEGRVPTPKWMREFAKVLHPDDPEKAKDAGTWYAATSADTMIGQSDVLVTPLQLANGYAAFGNGGTVYLPQVVYQVRKPFNGDVVQIISKGAISRVPIEPAWREAMLQGFEGVTVDGPLGRGTGALGFQGFDQDGFRVAGKTGTAQRLDENDSSLFVAFAPSRAPTIAMAAVVEFGGFGSEAALPVVRRSLEPLAQFDGDLKAMHESGLYAAPLGGWFDVEAAMAEFQPSVGAVPD